jgi:hypothetical protein
VDEAIQDNRPKIDNIFNNLEQTSENFNDFSQDIKYHPWKILAKGKETPKEVMAKERAQRVALKAGEAAAQAQGAAVEGAPKKQNFGPGKDKN